MEFRPRSEQAVEGTGGCFASGSRASDRSCSQILIGAVPGQHISLRCHLIRRLNPTDFRKQATSSGFSAAVRGLSNACDQTCGVIDLYPPASSHHIGRLLGGHRGHAP